MRHVARLARLALPEDRIATITGQLESILDYVSHLQSIDTAGAPTTTRAVDVVNVTRADQASPATVREELLNQAPQREGDLLLVPRILADQEAG